MSDSRAEAELLGRACRGDESAFQLIYERHRQCVFRFAYRMIGSAGAAEDITHDCFLALLQKPHLFNPDRASLRTYMCAAARNMAWKQLRLQKIHHETDEEDCDQHVEWQDNPYERMVSSEIAEQVRQAVLSLPPLQREAIILYEFEELSLSDIAAIAQTDVGSIKSRLHRARNRLRMLLAQWLPSGELYMVGEMKS
jgi:RNA polymerase sigma-70 factor (ECF subfamily)